MQQEKVFALDIGTRTVVGVMLEKVDKHYKVIDIHMLEHKERAMIDGQIHDVLSVANTITEIKKVLEKKHGPLKKVCVAAAGRSLKTERATATFQIHGKPMIKKEDVLHLELQAVQQAQALAANKSQVDKTNYYYCVGYSILYYRLDGEEIANLIDQQGEEVSVEIIATFLPRVVVESLIAAIQRAGLQMEALTLEPIAAIHVLIPPSMRRLNVALVDVGAGTSDIAITNEGTITAYGMVPFAGDEVTETISDQYLLDFPLAETAKRQLQTNDTVIFQDILGFETELQSKEIIEEISPAIDRLASAICKEILTLNKNTAPKAVMLVGGGSLTPNLSNKLANMLQLPEKRVAPRGIEAIANLMMDEPILHGPEFVTPIGIAIAAKKSPVHYKSVYVNEQPVRLFEVNELTVGDCLLAAGIQTKGLVGKPGLAKIVTVNGKVITIRGNHGDLPVLQKNGTTCSLDDRVDDHDVISVEKGKDGSSPNIQIKELVGDLAEKQVFINGKEYNVTAHILCNGKKVPPETQVEDRDEIVCEIPKTVEELLFYLQKKTLTEKLQPLQLTVNHELMTFPQYTGEIFKNGHAITKSNTFEHLDELSITGTKPLTVKRFFEIKGLPSKRSITVLFNDKKVMLTKEPVSLYREGRKLQEEDHLFYKDVLTLEQKKEQPFIFQDLFKYVEIELPKNMGGKFILLKNNQEATFFEPLIHGDDCRIIWPSAQDK